MQNNRGEPTKAQQRHRWVNTAGACVNHTEVKPSSWLLQRPSGQTKCSLPSPSDKHNLAHCLHTTANSLKESMAPCNYSHWLTTSCCLQRLARTTSSPMQVWVVWQTHNVQLMRWAVLQRGGCDLEAEYDIIDSLSQSECPPRGSLNLFLCAMQAQGLSGWKETIY